MSRFGTTSALLQKVNSKLKGEKNPQEDDDDEGLGAYLSGLGKKKNSPRAKKKEIDWEKFGEVNDFSDEDKPLTKKSPETSFGFGGSKFLKKKKPDSNESTVIQKGNGESIQKSAALSKAKGYSSSNYSSKPQHDLFRGLSDSDMDMSFSLDGGQILGDVESLTPAIVPRSRTPDRSASEESMSIGKGGSKFLKKQYATERAPSENQNHQRLTALETKATPKPQTQQIKRATQPQPKSQKASVMNPALNKKAPGPVGSGEGNSQPGTKFQQNKPSVFHTQTPQHIPRGAKNGPSLNFDIDDDSSSMSVSIGKGGSRFMKKKPEELKVVVNKEKEKQKKEMLEKKLFVETPTIQSTNKKRDMFSLKSADKYATSVQLDSEDESLQGYIQNLANSSPSEVSLKTPPKSPKTPRGILKTPRTPRSLTPLEDIDEDEEKTHDNHPTLSDDEDSFRINVLDLDALDPPDFSPPEATNASTPKPGVKLQTKKLTKKQDSPKSKANEKAKNKSKKKPDKKQKSSSMGYYDDDDDDDLFARLQTVDDLLGDNKLDLTDTEIGTDMEREDDDYEDDFHGVHRSPSPLRGILSPSPKPDRTPRSGRTPRVRYSEEIIEHRSRSPSPEAVSSAPVSRTASVVYSVDFEDDSESAIKTEEPSETEESVISERIGRDGGFSSRNSSKKYSSRSRSESEYYSDDFMSATESRWASKRKEYALSSRSMDSMDSEYSMYSDTFSEYSESRSDTRSKTRKKQKKKHREVEIQTGASIAEMTYRWIPESTGVAYVSPGYGLGNLNPKLVATHVVSADTLEALTTYSPNVIALNEMMKQQLQLTENYINVQNHLHQSLVNSTQPDFIYTTLEDTKRYIKRHKKPTLTFDEALKQVKQEMGME